MSTGVFGTNDAPLQTVTLTNTTPQTGRVIPRKRAKDAGIAALFVTGENTSGTITNLTVEFRHYLGEDENGKSLYGAWQTLSNTFLATDYQNTGTDWNGDLIDVGANSGHILSDGIQFRFTGAGTHVTELTAIFMGS